MTPREQAIARARAVFLSTEGYTAIYDALVEAYEENERMRPVCEAAEAATKVWGTVEEDHALIDAVRIYQEQ